MTLADLDAWVAARLAELPPGTVAHITTPPDEPGVYRVEFTVTVVPRADDAGG